MFHVDLKYIKLLSPKLLYFKQIGKHAFRFRCPICGDSKKSKTKARGNVYEIGGNLSYKCFNSCGSKSIGGLINYVDPSLYREYIMERYKNDTRDSPDEPIFKKEIVELLTDEVLDDLIRIDTLPSDHQVVKYVESRKIPKDKWGRLYYVDKFKTWVNSIIPGKFDASRNDNPRLIFPYFNKHGRVFAINARTLADEEPKYIIVKFVDDCETVYGLDTVNWSLPVYVVEGQLDSLFLPNCLAVSGSTFDIDTIRKIKSNCTLVLDNEPRNKETTKLIYKVIDLNYNICLFPETFGYKDINAAIIGGMSVEQIIKVINKNTFKGLAARIELTKWRK